MIIREGGSVLNNALRGKTSFFSYKRANQLDRKCFNFDMRTKLKSWLSNFELLDWRFLNWFFKVLFISSCWNTCKIENHYDRQDSCIIYLTILGTWHQAQWKKKRGEYFFRMGFNIKCVSVCTLLYFYF